MPHLLKKIFHKIDISPNRWNEILLNVGLTMNFIAFQYNWHEENL